MAKGSSANRPGDMDSLTMKFGTPVPDRTKMGTVAKVSGGAVEVKGPKVAPRTPQAKK